MDFLLSKLLPQLIYPLGLALLMQAVALAQRRRRWAGWLSGAGLGLLWLAAMPITSRSLTETLERQALGSMPNPLPHGDAAVVLGGGLESPLPPRRHVEVNEAGDRLLEGVRLLRQGQVDWLVVSGGRVSLRQGDGSPGEGEMAAALARELGAPAQRLLANPNGRNTAEEVRALDALARQRGWHRLLLVTSATHMPRALASFRRHSSLQIVPVAVDVQVVQRLGQPTAGSLLQDLLPDARALSSTTTALKELVGLAVYRLRGWL